MNLAVLAVSASAAMQQTCAWVDLSVLVQSCRPNMCQIGQHYSQAAEWALEHLCSGTDWPTWHMFGLQLCTSTDKSTQAHVCCMAALAETGPRLPGVTCLLLDCKGWDRPICQGRMFTPMHLLVSADPKQPQHAVLAPCPEAVR